MLAKIQEFGGKLLKKEIVENAKEKVVLQEVLSDNLLQKGNPEGIIDSVEMLENTGDILK